MLFRANAFAQDFSMHYDKGRISISAQNADIKTVLAAIARETKIFIRFPQTLKKQITMELSAVSVRKALRRILKGQDYAIVYSASKNDRNRNSVSEVYVLPQQWGENRAAVIPAQDRRQEAAIRNSKKRLDSLRNRLEKTEQGSRAANIITRQIRSVERTLQRLERR